jgi:hypothetical protein
MRNMPIKVDIKAAGLNKQFVQQQRGFVKPLEIRI